MSIFKDLKKYKKLVLPTAIIIIAVIIVCLAYPKFCYTFLVPVIIGLVTSVVWAVLYWIFITSNIREKEKMVEEAAFKRFHPHISAFVDIIDQKFILWGEDIEEFRKKVENYIEEHPKQFQDSEKRIKRFKAICLDYLSQDFIDTMSRLDNDSWDEIIQASERLKEDLFTLHIYLPHISLEYAETIINLTTKLEYFVRGIKPSFGQWKSSSRRKDEIKLFLPSINLFHEILKMVDEFMTSIRPILKLGKEETTK